MCPEIVRLPKPAKHREPRMAQEASTRRMAGHGALVVSARSPLSRRLHTSTVMPRCSFRPRWLLLSLLVLLVACEAGGTTGLPTLGSPGRGSSGGSTGGGSNGGGDIVPGGFDGGILASTNAERTKTGLKEYVYSGALETAARLQAEQVAATGVFAHDIPGARYPTLTDRVKAGNYPYSVAGENLALMSRESTAAHVVAAWMNSPGHAANILNEGYTEIGIATATAKNGMLIVVQVFGSR